MIRARLITSFFAFGLYLALTAGSGAILKLWAPEELLAGLFLSVVVGWVAGPFFASPGSRSALQPVRWLRAAAYVAGPFFLEMARANLDVAYRVLTGRIRPAIVRVRSGMKTDLGTLLLANSITLTPGTLTVGIDEASNDLFIHMINVPEGFENREIIEAPEVFSMFDCPAWIRRIAE